MAQRTSFRLYRRGREVKLEVVGEFRWKVVAASPETGFEAGDEVCPARAVSWRAARRRVNGARTALSPNRLVLLRGRGFERSEAEVADLLRRRPWDPDLTPAA
jgi:hypothetical protein